MPNRIGIFRPVREDSKMGWIALGLFGDGASAITIPAWVDVLSRDGVYRAEATFIEQVEPAADADEVGDTEVDAAERAARLLMNDRNVERWRSLHRPGH